MPHKFTVIETICINNHNFTLHQSGAVFWAEKQLLLISDVHLGKISHFRKFGSAVPRAAIGENFKRLTNVVEHFKPLKICFLGDLFHSSLNVEWGLFEDWMEDVSAEVILVAGNHDIISEIKYEKLGIKVYSEVISGSFLLTHLPEERNSFFNICGHLHPGIKLRGFGRQTLKLPCFFQSSNQFILPAFGEFTGNFYVNPVQGDQVYAITKKEVIQVA